jgi:hypothetical protein
MQQAGDHFQILRQLRGTAEHCFSTHLRYVSHEQALYLSRANLTSNETEAKTEQDVGQDGTENSGLYDEDIRAPYRSLEQDHEQDKLHNGTKRGLENDCNGLLRHLARQFLTSEP